MTFDLNKNTFIFFRESQIASFVDEHGMLKFVQGNFPRFTYDPSPLNIGEAGKHKSLGLLLETQSSNELLYSQNLMHSSWINAHFIAKNIENDIISPEGDVGGQKTISITDLSGHGFHLIKQKISLKKHHQKTVSIFVKKVENSGIKDFAIWAVNGVQIAVFSREDWSFISGIATSTNVEHYPRGWVRLSATYNSNNNDIYFGTSDGSQSQYFGENKKQFYLYGPQLEYLPFATSYIPTESHQKERGGDKCYFQGVYYDGGLYDSETRHINLEDKARTQMIKDWSPEPKEIIVHQLMRASRSCEYDKKINTYHVCETLWKSINYDFKFKEKLGFIESKKISISSKEIREYFDAVSVYKNLNLNDLKLADLDVLKYSGISREYLNIIFQDSVEWENILRRTFTQGSNNHCLSNIKNNHIKRFGDSHSHLNSHHYYQQSILETGYMYSICPFSGQPLRSNQSFYVQYLTPTGIPTTFYRFLGHEVFYVIVGGWDGGKLGLYIPKLEMIINAANSLWDDKVKFEPLINIFKAKAVLNFEKVTAYIQNSAFEQPKKIAITVGNYLNLGHHIWNELTGIQNIMDRPKLLSQVHLFIVCPGNRFEFSEIFPEVSPEKTTYINQFDDLFDLILDRDVCLVRLTDFHITEALSKRIFRASTTRCKPSFLERVNQSKQHYPLLWINLRNHNKVWINQGEGYAKIIDSLSVDYPDMAIVFDGLPDTQKIINRICELVDCQVKIYDATDCSIHETIHWAYNIDAYIAVIGTGLTFPSWLANKPGVTHGDSPHCHQELFWSSVRENSIPPKFIPKQYILDSGKMYGNYNCDWKIIYNEIVRVIQLLKK